MTGDATDRQIHASDWLARARVVAGVAAAEADASERGRELTPAVLDAIAQSQLVRLLMPKHMGGAEQDFVTLNNVVAAVSAGDASTGWCLAQALTSTHATGYLPSDVLGEVFLNTNGIVCWGPPAGLAKASIVDGGYRVTGKWRFGSGGQHSKWFGGHSIVHGADGKPMLDKNGAPQFRTMLFPREQAHIIDAWHTLGLRATRSNDYEVTDLFIPEKFSTWRDFQPDRREPHAFFSIPMLTLYGIAFSGVAIGIADACLTEFMKLAENKKGGGPFAGATATLSHNAVVRADIAKARAKWRRARAFLHEMFRDVWSSLVAGEPLVLTQRADLRLAITGAMKSSCEVVDYAFTAAGSNAIFTGSALERRFRDMHTMMAHGQAQMSNFESAGEALFGTEPKNRL
jgi:alkylation response protein AidB-like acyl-CoA dehydrogenase